MSNARVRFLLTALAGSLMTTTPLAADAQEAAPPPEVARTVASFAGHWVLEGTEADPSQPPARVAGTIDCVRAALGAAVSCAIAVNIAGFGAVEATAVVGFSPDEGVVRWMEISSTGEYHDHHGRWQGDRIEFEPLTYAVGGETATEYLAVGFPSDGNLSLESTTRLASGDAVLKCRGKRQP